MKKDRKKFWMCMVDEARSPTMKHWSESEARAEAERLSRQTEQDVFILEATEFVRLKKPEPPMVWKETIVMHKE